MEASLLGGGAGGIAHVAPDTEGALARAAKDDHPDRLVIGGRLEGLAQLMDRLHPKGVQPLGPVDRDRRPARAHLIEDVFEAAVGHREPSRVRDDGCDCAGHPIPHPPAAAAAVSRMSRRRFAQRPSSLPVRQPGWYQSFVASITRHVFTMRDRGMETAAEHPVEGVIREVSPRYRIQAIERAVSILNAFSMETPELGVTELAEKVGLHKFNRPPVHGEPRRRRPGRAQRTHRPLPPRAPHLRARRSRDAADEPLGRGTAVPGEPGARHRRDRPPGRARRGEAIYIERVEARRALRVPSAIGRGYPAHATNLGKVLLADLPPERVSEIIAERGLAAFTPNTITDPDELTAELERIRERGYAIDDEEYDEGLRCIWAGVRDHSGHVVSALGIGGPVTRRHPGPRRRTRRARDGSRARPLTAPRRAPIRCVRARCTARAQHGLPDAGPPAERSMSSGRPPPGVAFRTSRFP